MPKTTLRANARTLSKAALYDDGLKSEPADCPDADPLSLTNVKETTK